MRGRRQLAEHVWYRAWTKVNVGEPLFPFPWAKTLFYRALHDANEIFGFEMRGLKLENACLSFYIKPTDGLELPKIMQWVKQTFSVRLNVLTGRTGHVWGTGSTLRVELRSFALRNSRSKPKACDRVEDTGGGAAGGCCGGRLGDAGDTGARPAVCGRGLHLGLGQPRNG